MTDQVIAPLPPVDAKDAFHSVPLSSPEVNWPERSDQFLEHQWQIAQELLRLGQTLLGLIRQEPQSAAYLAQVHRLLEFGNSLARSVIDSATENPANAECRECCESRRQMEEALHRIYGSRQEDTATSVPDSELPTQAAGTLSTASPTNSSSSNTN